MSYRVLELNYHSSNFTTWHCLLRAPRCKMERMTPPSIFCRALPAFENDNWESVSAAFHNAEIVTLHQAWNEQSEAAFLPAQVRFGWSDSTLWIFAELHDADISNSATEPNQATHLLGDVFEIFLRPTSQDTYFEMHVTPENQTMQLRWPRPHHNFKDANGDDAQGEYCSGVLKHTATRVLASQNRWQVLAAVDMRQISDNASSDISSRNETVENIWADSERWLFSISRYDYTRGHEHPVLSSSSPHREINFHRQAEWGTLTFAR